MNEGVHGSYLWLTTDICLLRVLEHCPSLILERYVAVTSFDSGELQIGEKELEAGWSVEGGITYSPKVTSIRQIPRAGYDEWYVFPNQCRLGRVRRGGNVLNTGVDSGIVQVFVNYSTFILHDRTWKDLSELFWRQFDELRADSFVADGRDHLTIVSKHQDLFATIRSTVIELESQFDKSSTYSVKS